MTGARLGQSLFKTAFMSVVVVSTKGGKLVNSKDRTNTTADPQRSGTVQIRLGVRSIELSPIHCTLLDVVFQGSIFQLIVG